MVGRIDAEDPSADHRAVRVFADRALGTGLYQSLSLQHEHTENLADRTASRRWKFLWSTNPAAPTVISGASPTAHRRRQSR